MCIRDSPILSRQQFALQGAIKQIDISSHSSEDVVVGIRSQYNCSFFQSHPNSSTDRNLVSLIIIILLYRNRNNDEKDDDGDEYDKKTSHYLQPCCDARDLCASREGGWEYSR